MRNVEDEIMKILGSICSLDKCQLQGLVEYAIRDKVRDEVTNRLSTWTLEELIEAAKILGKIKRK